jgi:hypothetical protein
MMAGRLITSPLNLLKIGRYIKLCQLIQSESQIGCVAYLMRPCMHLDKPNCQLYWCYGNYKSVVL